MRLMTQRKKPAGRKRERGEVATIMVEVSLDLKAAIEALSRKNRRTRTAELTIALEEYLTKHGFWPPGGDHPHHD
jgi:predicted transcriptional regulator